jgi:WD40 repeat protein
LYGDPLPPGAVARLGNVRFRTPTAGLTALQFAADGRTLVSVEGERHLRFWEVPTGRERHDFILPPDSHWALAPDCRTLVATGSESKPGLWDTASRKMVRELDAENCTVGALGLTADGRVLAAALRDERADRRSVRLWELATGKVMGDLVVAPPKEKGEVFIPGRLSFTADGQTLSAWNESSGHSAIRLWDVRTGKGLAIPEEYNREESRPTPSPDGKLVAAVAKDDGTGSTVHLLDPATGKVVRDLEPALSGIVLGLRFSPDGRALLAVADDKGPGKLYLWNTAGGQQTLLADPDEWQVQDAVFAPDGRTVAVETEFRLYLYDATTGKQLHELDMRSAIDDFGRQTGIVSGGAARSLRDRPAIAFSADGKWLATAKRGHSVRLWDVATGKEIRHVPTGHEEPVRAVAVGPDGRTVASAACDGTLRLWEAGSGREVRVLRLPWQGDAPRVSFLADFGGFSVAFSPDGKMLAAVSPFNVVRLWEAATGRQRLDFLVSEHGVTSLAFTPDGKGLVTGGHGCFVLWDAATGRRLHRFAANNLPNADDDAAQLGWWFQRVAVSPDGRLVVAVAWSEHYREWDSSAEFRLWLWELATGKLRRRIPADEPGQGVSDGETDDRRGGRRRSLRVPLVAFAPDGRTLAWNSGSAVELLHLASGRPLRRFGGADDVAALAFSPAGDVLATASEDGRLRLYDPATGTILGVADGQRGEFTCLAFSPDSRTIIIGGDDMNLLVWDVAGVRESWRPRRLNLSGAEVDALWQRLADSHEAAAAMDGLEGAPEQAVALLRDRLRPAAPVNAREMTRLLADLDDSDFGVRKRAAAELERVAEQAEPALRKRLEEGPSPESRKRIEELLERLGGFVTRPEQVQALRAVEVLERIGTPEARAVLHDLAQGAPKARLTQEAKASLERLAKQASGR